MNQRDLRVVYFENYVVFVGVDCVKTDGLVDRRQHLWQRNIRDQMLSRTFDPLCVLAANVTLDLQALLNQCTSVLLDNINSVPGRPEEYVAVGVSRPRGSIL